MESENHTPTISVVVPLYNEEAIFSELIERLNQTLQGVHHSYEILFVDDGSTDTTAELIQKALQKDVHIRYLGLSRNFGHQAAVTAGLDYASGEVVIILDGDLQDPPEIIPKMLALWREGYDVVYGIRKRRKEWWGKRCMYFLFYRIIRSMTRSVNLPPDSGDFSLMSRRVVRALGAMPERNRYVRGLRSWVGYRQIGLPYEREARHKGVTKYSFRKLFHLAYDGIFSFSYVPLRAITIIGFLGALLSFVAVLVVVYLRLFTNLSIPGFASLASIVLFLGGVQVMALGIVGEYIRRIYDETKERPNYIVSEEGGFTETHGRKII